MLLVILWRRISREVTRWDNHSPTKGDTNAFDRLATDSLRYSCSELNSPRFRSGYCSDVSSVSESIRGKIAIRPKEIIQSPWVVGEEETRAKPFSFHHSEASLQQLDSSIGFLDELLSKELPGVIPENCRRAAHDSVPEPDSSTVSKEADQPSPVSVLDAAFADDFSYSPEYFESQCGPSWTSRAA
ncbi:hypothetical protein MLD38_020264 [Melastoma candidum]|uniref:Uncharacterized protein n=1 Tax=Melastoma candidum TaxID=119954 RepID=A0ACB9QKE2_9MYRT|nr:hypothetical protein MLD38_020264 [Melastoma candidum]